MKLLFIFLLSLLILIIPISAMADPFTDVPQGHWSYDAVNMLQEKGLVEGYPDGLFKGDRPMTRYEMAMVIARVIAKLEQVQASIPKIPDLSIYATKEDLEVINKLMKEFKGELDALGVRVQNIEESLGRLTSRVDELERVYVKGNITSVGTAVGFTKGGPTDPNAPYITEGYGYYYLSNGAAFTSRLDLDIGVNINENVTAGGTLTGYSSFGDPKVAYSWGILPPYNASGYSVNSIYDNGINFQGTLNKLWFNTKGDWEINGTYGEFTPQKFSPLIYSGIIASDYWGPTTFPLYGIDVNGKLFGHYKFEALHADDLTWADYGPFPLYSGINPFDLFQSEFYRNHGYHSRMNGVLGGYSNDKLDFDVSYMRIYEDYASNPGIDLIPKDEILLGFRGSYKICEEDKLKLFGEFNHSWFGFNLLAPTQSRTGGNALVLGGEGHVSSFDYKAQYVRTDGNYEPFNFHNITEYKYTACCQIGEGVYIPSIYRPNRTGFDIHGTYNFYEEKEVKSEEKEANTEEKPQVKGAIFGGISYLQQIDPTLDTNLQTTIGSSYGFQDHSFLNNSTAKGKEFFYDIGGNYQITDEFYVEGHFFSFNFQRDYALYQHDQTRRYAHLAGSYNLTDSFKLTGLYEMAQVKGIDDSGNNSDAILHIPGVSLSYNFSDTCSIGVDYRYYKYDDSLLITNDYNANRVSTWMKLSF